MSLSWLDRLTLFIHPQRVVLERQGWRGQASRQSVAVAPAVPGEADWQTALVAAQELLRAHGKRGALRVVVADQFVRYALLPWSDSIIGKQARLAMARALLKHALGDKAGALEIALDRPVFGKNGIAAGVDRNLLAGLRAAAKAQHLRLNSLQPRLIVELAAHHKQFTDGWFVCLEPGWLTLVGQRGGQLASLRNHRATTVEAGVLSGELAGLLVAERAAVDGNKVFISGCEEMAPLLVGWETMFLPAAVGGDAHA